MGKRRLDNIFATLTKTSCLSFIKVWCKWRFFYYQLSYAFVPCMHHMSDLTLHVSKAIILVWAAQEVWTCPWYIQNSFLVDMANQVSFLKLFSCVLRQAPCRTTSYIIDHKKKFLYKHKDCSLIDITFLIIPDIEVRFLFLLLLVLDG